MNEDHQIRRKLVTEAYGGDTVLLTEDLAVRDCLDLPRAGWLTRAFDWLYENPDVGGAA